MLCSTIHYQKDFSFILFSHKIRGRVWKIQGSKDMGSVIQGFLAHKKHPPLQDHRRAPGIGMLLDLMGKLGFGCRGWGCGCTYGGPAVAYA